MFSLASLRGALPSASRAVPTAPLRQLGQTRGLRNVLAPKRVKFSRVHKNIVPIPIGGSIKGTTLSFGDYGLRIKGEGARIPARTLKAVYETLRRKLKPVKGCKIWLRRFPDFPVSIKGNETRMGKGKGTFEYWATRCATGKVLFEIGGGALREELARDALRLANDKLPTKMEFITRSTPPRLGRLILTPDVPTVETTPALDCTVDVNQSA
ncbi:mitochondrial ribosomal protein L16 [Peniophora sp. CONT]|nr:mitochondrial ribosomal protein L16 [Peniophora sp. CONT]